MGKLTLRATTAVLLCFAVGSTLHSSIAKASSAPLKCQLTYSLAGWSAIYQHAAGHGRVTCDNGQHANVTIQMHGGGLTAGKFHVTGKADISNVYSIKEVFGSYAQAGASAGIVQSGTAQVVTKGTVSMALSGSGEGINLGVAVDKFDIKPAAH